MRPGDLARFSIRLAGWSLAVLLIAAAPARAAESCDFSGFNKPCAVVGGYYRVLLPEGDGPFPAMVYLYGSGGQSVSIASHPIFDAAVLQRGYALVVPVALKLEYRPGVFDSGWSLRNESSQVRDEWLFIRRVLDDAAHRFPIDRGRMLLAGQSRGAFLTWEIACNEPEIAAAYASHAGGYLGQLPKSCAEPVRFLDSHGLADPIVPYIGAPFVSGGATMAAIDQSLDTLARTNRCRSPEPVDAGLMLGMQRMHWTGCAIGSSLDLLLHEGGHSMPLEWFRAVLDWFEEPPEPAPDVNPLTRAAGSRPEGQFKDFSAGRSAFTATADTGDAPGRRLRPPTAAASGEESDGAAEGPRKVQVPRATPGASKKASQ